MKRGGVNSGSAGKGANRASTVKVTAAPRRRVSTTAPKAARPAAGATQLKSKASSTRGGLRAQKPAALARAVRTPGKAAHSARVQLKDFNSQKHKQALAKKGEAAARCALKKDGHYNSFHSMKHNAIHGIDFAALKRARDGKIRRAAVVESKASRNRSLGPSSFRQQTTHQYVLKSLLKAKVKKVKHADRLYSMAKDRKLDIVGSAYNKKTGRVRLHKVYEPRKPGPRDDRGRRGKR